MSEGINQSEGDLPVFSPDTEGPSETASSFRVPDIRITDDYFELFKDHNLSDEETTLEAERWSIRETSKVSPHEIVVINSQEEPRVVSYERNNLFAAAGVSGSLKKIRHLQLLCRQFGVDMITLTMTGVQYEAIVRELNPIRLPTGKKSK